MIGSLNAHFHAFYPSAACPCGVRERLFKQRQRHIVRTGAGDQKTAAFNGFHGGAVDIAVAACGVLHFCGALSKIRGIEDDSVKFRLFRAEFS